MRLPKSALLLLVMVSCASRPSWVHSLPDHGGALGLRAVGLNLPAGKWVRAAKNRFPYAHRTTYSDAREQIEISEIGRYAKLHLYAAVSVDNEEFIAYEEEGTVERSSGNWVLFRPEKSKTYQRSGPPVNVKMRRDQPYPFPAVSSIPFQEVSSGEPLLYLVDEYHGKPVLTPAAYERLGKVFDFGIFQGSETMYDSQSRHFQDFRSKLFEKSFQPTHYSYQGPEKSE